ncbi:ABC transporter ATP-binding protein [Oricola sp.]|uniref:ABC transporter ATP-binding protein n=1 Tax=Oricola sp. TaxID=1979950 RepID=UPI0025D7EDE3|nr:ABC transporter ATP-binding protein [Oricola sp.]MCI5075395.1 ABC transporter ATP-binding protein [Oricola sp.]
MTGTLEIRGLGRSFGGLKALEDISFTLEPGEILGIIGPNGAGKTTLFNTISGVYKPSAGAVSLDGRDISGLRPDQIGRLGIGRTFQSTTVFPETTVRETLERAQSFLSAYSPMAWLRSFGHRAAGHSVDRVLERIGLDRMADAEASSLAYGFQKILGIGMALVQAPHLLLMDEPAAGLNSSEKIEVTDLIRGIRDEYGIGILLVEHDMKMVMGLCDRVKVISYGRQVAIGTPEEIRNDPDVIDAYLGRDHELA